MVVARDQRMGSWISGLSNEVTKRDDEIRELKRRLEEAEKVIEFYSDPKSVGYNTREARLYIEKYKDSNLE